MNLLITQYCPVYCYKVWTSSLRSTVQSPVAKYEPPHYAVLSSLLLQSMNLLITQYCPVSCYNVRTSSSRSTSQPPITMYEPPHYAVISSPLVPPRSLLFDKYIGLLDPQSIRHTNQSTLHELAQVVTLLTCTRRCQIRFWVKQELSWMRVW